MSRFADTFFYLAILNPNDAAHAEAQRLSRSVRGRIVTTAFVLTELADGMSRPPARQAYLRLVALLESDPRVQIIPTSETLFRKGSALYAARPDKEWSLT